MAESVVSSAAKWIADLLIQEAKSLYGVRGQVEDLLAELRQMQRFLKHADAKQDENQDIGDLVADIREVAYEAENVIASFLVEPRRREGLGNFLMRCVCIFCELIDRHNIGSEINSIKAKITRFKADLQSYGIIAIAQERQGSSSTVQRQTRVRRTYSHVYVEDDFVGCEPETVLSHLVGEEAKNYRAISICGMGGLGKTTLARKVYHHTNVRCHFDAFAWVSISQAWQLKDVLQRILTKLLPHESGTIVNMIEDQLVKQLYQVQLEKKCLVVLDDIWSLDAWDNLSPAFPMENKGSKIILTTRNKNVAAFVDQGGFLHEPKCLAKEESWKLFEKKAFPKMDFTDFKVDETLKNLGMKMVEECKGLPLAIVVLGGLLRTKHTLGEWQIVHRSIDSYLKREKFIGGQNGTVLDVLALSYQDLPYHLKACFLYLGNYPEDFKIEAETLYQLWMAEGIVSQKEEEEENRDKETMMDVAERYLGELAQRCMVQVEFEPEMDYSPIRGSRRFKYCQLHDLMRDLCLTKGKEENFLKVIKNKRMHPSSSSTEPSGSINGSKTHRLAIHQAENGVEQSAHHIRAVLFFMNEEFNYQLAGNELRCFSKNSKFLRVIHFNRVGALENERPTELPKEIGNQILLRYLGLGGTLLTKLPSSIGKLRYLQTLDLRTLSEISIPNVLWKMEGLIHIYFPLYGRFSIEGGLLLRIDGLSKLETIENLDPNKVDVGGFSKLTNLQRLTVRIQQKLDGLVVVNNYLLNSKHQLQYVSIDIIFCDFHSVEELSLLRMLLCCDCLFSLCIEGFISKLPEYDSQFSPNLTSLTLEDSQLNEDPMATLEKLPNLRFLWLCNAFVGKEMVCSAHGFRHLQDLRLWGLLTLEEWKVDDGAMPNLSSLDIHYCKNLKMIPDGLRFISTLEELVIGQMPIAFKDRLQVIDGEEGEDFQKIRHIPSIKISG